MTTAGNLTNTFRAAILLAFCLRVRLIFKQGGSTCRPRCGVFATALATDIGAIPNVRCRIARTLIGTLLDWTRHAGRQPHASACAVHSLFRNCMCSDAIRRDGY